MAPVCGPAVSRAAVQIGPESPAHVRFSSKASSGVFTNPSACKATVEGNDTEGYVVKIATTGASNDPYIAFNYSNWMSMNSLQPVSADEYKYFIIRTKIENFTNTEFELFFTTSKSTGISADKSVFSVFSNADEDYQYITFNLGKSDKWTGNAGQFRFDFERTSAAAGETMTISDMYFARTLEEVRAITNYSPESLNEGLTDEEKLAAAKLFAMEYNMPQVSNEKLTAEKEDASIDLWFDHTYTKTPAESVTSTGLNTYQILMAKNEIEDCQFLLAATSDKKGLTAELSEFTDGDGHTLRADMWYGHYFEDVQGKTIADPIPPLKGSFDLTANRSKLFLIKVYSEEDSHEGQYSAVLTIKDADGNEVKKANVYAYVWNFALPEATNCKTLMDVDQFTIYATYAFSYPVGEDRTYWFNGDDGATYAAYYEYLLENKINAYSIPYTNGGSFDPRADKYITDPRVQAFNPIGWKTAINATNTQNAYNYLKERNATDKAYFYTVDEPQNVGMLDQILADAAIMKQYFPGYKYIVPMHLNSQLDSTGKMDYFEYVKDAVNVWCPHNFFFNGIDNYRANPALTYRMTAKIEKELGTFTDRMAAQQAEGDEVWWYVTRYPQEPEISLSMETQAVKYRIFFWQQKLYDVDGFLYYCVNDWADTGENGTHGLNSKHETDTSAYTPYDCYGNGVLLYPGIPFGTNLPIGSLRLECVRDGIEDYDYMTILDELYGEGTSDLVIKQITTSLGEYKADEELFTTLRTAVGNLITAKLTPGYGTPVELPADPTTTPTDPTTPPDTKPDNPTTGELDSVLMVVMGCAAAVIAGTAVMISVKKRRSH